MSPRSDNPDNVNGQPSGRLPGNNRSDNMNNTNNNIDAPPIVKNRNPRAHGNRNQNGLPASPRNARASKNLRETRAHESIRDSNVQSSSSRGGGSGPGGQTHCCTCTSTSSTGTGTGTCNDQSDNMPNPIHRKVTKKKRLDEYVPFDSDRYAAGANASLYMRPPSFSRKNRTHDRKYQKKKRSHSRRTKPN